MQEATQPANFVEEATQPAMQEATQPASISLAATEVSEATTMETGTGSFPADALPTPMGTGRSTTIDAFLQ